MKCLYTLFLFTFSSGLVFAQAGNPDSTFGTNGIVTTDFSMSDDQGRSVAVQPDGKIVVAGSTDGKFMLCRYNTSGTLDNTFGNDGKVAILIGTGNCSASCTIIQPDDKIIAAGGSSEGFALVRYLTDGTIDSSFGLNGVTTTAIGSDDAASSVALEADGKIVATGSSFNGSVTEFAVSRYNSNGIIDSSFGVDGVVTTLVGGASCYARSVATQADEKAVVAGFVHYVFADSIALVRYNYDGDLDTSFGSGGKVITAPEGFDGVAYGVAIQPDGKIIAAGAAYDNDGYFTVVRYNANGTPDSTFGINGAAISVFNIDFDVIAYAVAIQPDEKIIATGTSYHIPYTFVLVRYNTDGTADNNFGNNGIVTTDVAPYDDNAYSVALEPDEKIVVAGTSYLGPEQNNLSLVRYLSDLTLGILDFSSSSALPLVYPNPVQQTVQLLYTILTDESLTISLYDVNGRLIKTFLAHQKRSAGEHKENLNTGDIPAGNYLLTLSNGSANLSVKMVKR